ncbi:tRNA pseudouridine synthase d, partial [Globisporangium splendens]
MGRSHFASKRGGGGRRGGRGRGRGGGRDSNGDGASSSFVNFRAPGYTDGFAKSVDESVVGIQRFLTPEIGGFHGTIKERYSDFIVREVATNGEVVQLTDVKRFTSAKAKGKEQKVSEIFKQRVFNYLNDAVARGAAAEGNDGARAPEEPQKMAIPPAIHSLVGTIAGRLLSRFNQNKRLQAEKLDRANIVQLKASIAKICDDATAESLEQFTLRILDERAKEAQVPEKQEQAKEEEDAFYFPTIASKESRIAVHAAVREFGETLLVSDTVPNKESVSVIRVRRMTVGGKKRKDMDQRGSRNKWPSDRPDYLQFVLYKRNMETNSVMSQLAKAMNVNVSAFSYAGTKDKRGITTQLCTIYRGSVERLEMLNRTGRDLETFNFLVGNAKYVPNKLNLGDLQGNQFSLAIRSLPGDDVVSDAHIHDAVASWVSLGFINYFGLQRFGTKSIPTHEIGRAILKRDYKLVVDLVLKPQEGDASLIAQARQQFQDDQNIEVALRALPPYLIAERALLQGLQTYVWNRIASERIETFAKDKPVVGDLVVPHDAALAEEVAEEDENSAIRKDDANEGPVSKKARHESSSSASKPICITAENINQYSIYDVVLPLPGYDILYPENGLKRRYEEILSEDGVDFDSLLRATNSEYHLPGSFRHLLKKPIHVTHEIKRYDDATVPLLETEVNRLEGKALQTSIPDGKFRALCLEFQLIQLI